MKHGPMVPPNENTCHPNYYQCVRYNIILVNHHDRFGLATFPFPINLSNVYEIHWTNFNPGCVCNLEQIRVEHYLTLISLLEKAI